MLSSSGLDYWKYVKVREYNSLKELREKYPKGEFYFIENFGEKYYTDVDFSNEQQELFFIFGSESKGIPREIIKGDEDYCLKIHMGRKMRSLNLSNTAAIIIYEVLRQQGFPSMS